MARCKVCFRHCEIKEDAIGFCGARTCRDGKVVAANYARITSLALDPIEKKPLNRFYPGSLILSVGSYGCNLRCPFCQNHEISWSERAWQFADEAEYLPPESLVEVARSYQKRGNIGIAFTYNEPLIGYEYVIDAAKLAHEADLKTVLVTNGTAQLPVLEELALRGVSEARLGCAMEQGDLSCHLSGAESQVMRWIRQGSLPPEQIAREIYDLLARTAARMLTAGERITGFHDALICGGIASSGLFRRMLTERLGRMRSRLRLVFGDPELSGDNAVGVALIGADRLREETDPAQETEKTSPEGKTD